MHIHHQPPPQCNVCGPWPDWARHLEAHLNAIDERLTAMSEQQSEIDADVTELQSAAASIQAEIAALEAQVAAGQPLDLTGLKSAADALAAIAPTQPSTPVDTGTGDDGSQPTA